jgi:hypothetical protein
VFVAVNNVVSDAVLATNATFVSSNVYSPIRASVRPAPAIVPEQNVIDETVSETDGVKNMKKICPEFPADAPLVASPRG